MQEYSIKIDRKGIGYKYVEWTQLARNNTYPGLL